LNTGIRIESIIKEIENLSEIFNAHKIN